ncbi:hypothetical protein POJ06DRAFT_122406 [Lipomyces tetrasporus]|uniref:DNA recombination and repair protein Rad51-like C-terminal domain-containing protein n=1 Tax=Lipomyces tetrasporus TaxID=54092 RepID=A0AAD7QRA2_9ASCO|nr:uncharacterized protein POJ06DRAFT_122406 [Lipomyces tetrasporus]KAJ8100018.1 hypothetical protein POJ06DRAFT_122406 [Lipomyces tetrasporus]
MPVIFGDIFPSSRISVLTGHAHDDIKSIFAMHTLAEFLVANPTRRAIWIDTLGVFQGFLFRDILMLQFLRQHSDDRAVEIDDELTKAIENVQFIRVFDATGLQEAMLELENSFVNTTYQVTGVDDSDDEVKGLLVIDSISATYSRAMANDQPMGNSFQVFSNYLDTDMLATGHAYMESFLKLLGKFSRTYNFSAILINTAVVASAADVVRSQFESVTQKPSLGPTLLYLVDFCTLISRDLQSGVYVFEILADRWRATEGHLLSFELTNNFEIAFNNPNESIG